jgi:hypothetical protein
MNRLARPLFLALAGIAVTSALAAAEPVTNKSIALGFHSRTEPLGGRWWFSPQLGVDLGFGFGLEKAETTIDTNGDLVDDTRIEDTLGHWAVEAGMPWTAWRWEGVRVMLRPGLSYQSEDDFGSFLQDGSRVKLNTFGASGEIEVEVPVATNVTLSAAQGLQYTTSKLDAPGATSTWTLDATGQDFTTIGFHVYLWSPQ